jgi:hypothetical protein
MTRNSDLQKNSLVVLELSLSLICIHRIAKKDGKLLDSQIMALGNLLCILERNKDDPHIRCAESLPLEDFGIRLIQLDQGAL